jgi:hypothetical protein
MQTDKSFPLSLDFEGSHYEGVISPSEVHGRNGLPVYFRVMLGGKLYAYLCCSDYGWKKWDLEDKSTGLTQAIGAYIRAYYE